MHGFIINAVIFQHLFAESKFLGRDGIKTLQNNFTRFLKRQLPFNVFFFYVDNFPALGFIKTENIVHCFSHISSLYNRLHIVILCKISISRKVNIVMPSCLYATPFPPVNRLAEWIPAAGKQRAGSKDEEGDNFKNDCP